MLYLALVSLIWAFSYGLIKGELTGLDANLVACLRLAISLPIFLPFLRLKAVSMRGIAWLAIIGAVQYGLMYNLYIAAFGYLEAYQVATLTVTTPLFVTLLYDALEQRFRPRNLGLALLAAAGAAVIVFDGRALDATWTGIALVQLSNLCFAFGQVAYKRYREQETKLLDAQVFGLLYMGAVMLCLITTTAYGGWGDLGIISLRQWGVLLYLGVLASGLCFFWWNKGAVKTNPATLAVFNNVKIPLAVLVSLIIFGESANLLRLLIGGGIIALALWLATRAKATR